MQRLNNDLSIELCSTLMTSYRNLQKFILTGRESLLSYLHVFQSVDTYSTSKDSVIITFVSIFFKYIMHNYKVQRGKNDSYKIITSFQNLPLNDTFPQFFNILRPFSTCSLFSNMNHNVIALKKIHSPHIRDNLKRKIRQMPKKQTIENNSENRVWNYLLYTCIRYTRILKLSYINDTHRTCVRGLKENKCEN